MDKEVLIHVRGLQTMDADGEQEPLEIVVPGQYYFRNGSHYLRYEEVMEDFADVADALDPTVQRGMRDVVLVLDLARRLAVLVKLHDLPLERLLVVAGMLRAGHRRPPISCHSSLIGLSNTL